MVKLLVREGDIGLFRKTKLGLKFESFEVVVIQSHEAFTVEPKRTLRPESHYRPQRKRDLNYQRHIKVKYIDHGFLDFS
jgi:hypothetical protein